MKIAVNCSYLFHRNIEGILFQFTQHHILNTYFNNLNFAQYTNSNKGWIIPKNKQFLKQVIEETKHIAIVNIASLKTSISNNLTTNFSYKQTSNSSLNNSNYMAKLKEHLVNSGYSSSTIKTYTGEFSVFLQAIKEVDVTKVTINKLSGYFYYCNTVLKLSENTLHSRINALKYFYEQVLGYEKFFIELPRPKKRKQLPKVVSEEKIITYLWTIKNLKHKTILLLAYSAGLRVSEIVNLKVTDIDSHRMQVSINGAKGKKDRRVPLSESILPLLRTYYKQYKPMKWLFEGVEKGEQYSARSAQLIFKKTYQRANLPSNVSFHSLRHSYATHLLDNGTDIKYIQELLGHNDIKTTLRYIHVTNRDLSKIESPLDKILRKHNLEL